MFDSVNSKKPLLNQIRTQLNKEGNPTDEMKIRVGIGLVVDCLACTVTVLGQDGFSGKGLFSALVTKQMVPVAASEDYDNFIREENPNFLVRISPGGVGVFHVAKKSSVCLSKPRETKLFGGISRDFAGISQGCPKSLRKTSLGSILGP